MKKKQKQTKIGLITTLALSPVLMTGITIGALIGVNKIVKSETNIKALKITGNIEDLSSKQGQSYTSPIIEVKCFDQNLKEMISEDKPILTLYDEAQNTSLYDWISINQTTNQIIINDTAPIGNYKFYLQASCKEGDGIILSDYKQVNVQIVSTSPVIDTLILDNFAYYELPDNSTKTISYTLKAWSGEEEVEFPDDREVECKFWAKKITPSQNQEPTFTWTREGNKINLTIKSYDYSYPENYNFYVTVYSPGETSLSFASNNTIRVYNGGVTA